MKFLLLLLFQRGYAVNVFPLATPVDGGGALAIPKAIPTARSRSDFAPNFSQRGAALERTISNAIMFSEDLNMLNMMCSAKGFCDEGCF